MKLVVTLEPSPEPNETQTIQRNYRDGDVSFVYYNAKANSIRIKLIIFIGQVDFQNAICQVYTTDHPWDDVPANVTNCAPDASGKHRNGARI